MQHNAENHIRTLQYLKKLCLFEFRTGKVLVLDFQNRSGSGVVLKGDGNPDNYYV